MTGSDHVLAVYPGHNSNATLVSSDGTVTFALEEARLSRVKDQAGMPFRVLDLIRQRFHPDQMIRVTIRDPRSRRLFRDIDFTLKSIAKKKAPPNWTYLLNGYLNVARRGRTVEVESREKTPWFLSPGSPIVNVSHHDAHAASAYYCSGFTEGPVMTLDGQGDDRYSCTFSWGSRDRLKTLNKLYYNEAPLGYNFQLVTAMLGFHGGRHPGKITGLAAYGEYREDCVAKLRSYLDGNWRKRSSSSALNYPSHLLFTAEGKKELQHVRQSVFKDYSLQEMACAIQYLTEEKTLSLIRTNLGPPPYTSLALAGGVFANVKLNQRIKEIGTEKIFIQPAMGDEGLSLGAALAIAAREGNGRCRAISTVFFGPDFSTDDMETALKETSLSYKKPDDIEEAVAGLLAEGNVVARYNGRLEYGPRALGNRSILYATEDKTVNDWLNKRLERTEFMPFAPVTRIEDAEKCYLNYSGAEFAAKFMTITFPCTEWMKRTSPAVVHVDGTARPQLLVREDNPGMYRLLSLYNKMTGIPSLINTSFNMHEEPIVCTPRDAVRSFVRGHLDYLALGPFLVHHPDAKKTGK